MPHALEQLLRLDRLQHCLDRCTGHGPATEGRAERFDRKLRAELRRHEQRRTREAVAERLGRRKQIRLDAMEIGGEGVPGTTDAALDLIEDEERSHLVATLAECAEELPAQIHG